jgi:cell division protein FtsI/penicillin-binding protein 2
MLAMRMIAVGVLLALQPAAWCAGLDAALARAMSGKPGTAVVADVASGRIVASHRLELARTRAASPGSAIKPFTLRAWLETHGADVAEKWMCPRQLRISGRRLDCTHPDLAVPLAAAGALAYSCNTYFAHLALGLRAAEFARSLRRVAATVSSASTPEELQLQALGEWGIEVTPMELLQAYRRLALERDNPALAAVFEGLDGAVEYGSARLAGTPGLHVAGKTGTGLGHAWFAGFAGASKEKPEIVVVIFLDQGRGGSDAAPVAGEVFKAFAENRRPAR